MTIARRLKTPATIHHWTPGANKDVMGDVTTSFTDETTVTYVRSSTSSEMRNGRLTLVALELAFLLPSVSLAHMDELTVNGIRYSFDGEPWKVINPRTQVGSHWEVQLRRVS